ncbi:coiled-coil domain-containing protein 8 [Onychomys torridus]|uniref:coiled-coil domain-containing protein 8 n=1 Tax=Onychomys torridus TaxID=38674 RepID=UPI00167F3A60|nr:coiled-coil domain-containing protein 8 [Onychomys torridus]XP_036049858.1 coiled-coil domain-containing protein 8 [Onychomys torridus]
MLQIGEDVDYLLIPREVRLAGGVWRVISKPATKEAEFRERLIQFLQEEGRTLEDVARIIEKSTPHPPQPPKKAKEPPRVRRVPQMVTPPLRLVVGTYDSSNASDSELSDFETSKVKGNGGSQGTRKVRKMPVSYLGSKFLGSDVESEDDQELVEAFLRRGEKKPSAPPPRRRVNLPVPMFEDNLGPRPSKADRWREYVSQVSWGKLKQRVKGWAPRSGSEVGEAQQASIAAERTGELRSSHTSREDSPRNAGDGSDQTLGTRRWKPKIKWVSLRRCRKGQAPPPAQATAGGPPEAAENQGAEAAAERGAEAAPNPRAEAAASPRAEAAASPRAEAAANPRAEAVASPRAEAAPNPRAEAAARPRAEAAAERGAEAAPNPRAEAAASPRAEAAANPRAEAAANPRAEAAANPRAEAAASPRAEAAANPRAEAAASPRAEAAADPTAEAAANPRAEAAASPRAEAAARPRAEAAASPRAEAPDNHESEVAANQRTEALPDRRAEAIDSQRAEGPANQGTGAAENQRVEAPADQREEAGPQAIAGASAGSVTLGTVSGSGVRKQVKTVRFQTPGRFSWFRKHRRAFWHTPRLPTLPKRVPRAGEARSLRVLRAEARAEMEHREQEEQL